MALVCARAHRQRRKVLLAQGAYHGAAPWCMPQAAGGTPEDRAHIIPFRYNDVASLAEAVELAGDDLAGIFATPFRHEAFSHQYLPAVAYAKEVRRICDERDALLVVDDVRAGFRMARDCSWSALGVQPDLSTWGKAIANGHPISALLGSDKARTAATRIYVTGSFWFSAVPMEAAIATLHQIRESDYLERIVHTGQLLRDGLDAQAESHGFTLRQTGPVQMPQMPHPRDLWLLRHLRHLRLGVVARSAHRCGACPVARPTAPARGPAAAGGQRFAGASRPVRPAARDRVRQSSR